MPKISQIIRSKFPYEPTGGQLDFFALLNDLLPDADQQLDTLIVKGFAGTGKTTIISALVQVLPLFNMKFALMAPTGRAAKVISSYTNKKAYTIHKLIYKQVVDRKSGELKFTKQKNYFKNTVFIVDEASMISDNGGIFQSSLLDDLIKYVFETPGNRLIFIGDNAQLPPVSDNRSPALDLDYLLNRFGMNAKTVMLDQVLRQQSDSGILHNANAIRKTIFDQQKSFSFETKPYADIFRMNHEKLEEGIRYAYDKFGMESTAIICRSNWQAVQYNQYVRRNILFKEEEIEAGDLVMVVKNNYFVLEPDSPAGFIANGEFAEIRKIISFDEKYDMRFADVEMKLIDYPEEEPFVAKVMLDTLHSHAASLSQEDSNKLYFAVKEDYENLASRKKIKEAMRADEYLNALQIKFAYALTCHKSQGGQWGIVFIDQGKFGDLEYSKEHYRWLYTALTRAQEEVFLVNFDHAYFLN